MKNQLPASLNILQDRRSNDVTGQQIRSELQSPELQSQQRRQRLDQLGLAEPRQTLQKQMASSEQTNHNPLKQFPLPENRGAKPVKKFRDRLLCRGDIFGGEEFRRFSLWHVARSSVLS